MDSYLLVFIFSGLCMATSISISLFVLAASILSSRISQTEGIDEVYLTVRPLPATSRSPLTDFSGAATTTLAEG